MVCTLNGPLTHFGELYTISPANYGCSGGPGAFSPGGIVSAAIQSFHQTGQGIEGHRTASTSSGCSQSIHFAAVLK
jgi:hypothetical protein